MRDKESSQRLARKDGGVAFEDSLSGTVYESLNKNPREPTLRTCSDCGKLTQDCYWKCPDNIFMHFLYACPPCLTIRLLSGERCHGIYGWLPVNRAIPH